VVERGRKRRKRGVFKTVTVLLELLNLALKLRQFGNINRNGAAGENHEF
jgi:hypothetical protein